MEYVVLVEHVLPDDCGWDMRSASGGDLVHPGGVPIEPGTVISPGDMLVDGDIEPDIMASLWSKGIIEPADMEAEEARLADAEPEPEAEDDQDE